MAANEKKADKIKHPLEVIPITVSEKKDRKTYLNTEDLRSVRKNIKCTRCGASLQNLIDLGQKLPVHPLLGLVFCKNCCDFYGDGEFSVDSEGEEKYCRWCGEGGTLYECAKCIWHFCKKCIKTNLGIEALSTVKNDKDWECFACNPKPLWPLRHLVHLAGLDADANLTKKKEERQTRLRQLQNKVSSRKQRSRKVIQLSSSSSSSVVTSSDEALSSLCKKGKVDDSFASLLEISDTLQKGINAETTEKALQRLKNIGEYVKKQAETLLRSLPKRKTNEDLKEVVTDIEKVISKAVKNKQGTTDSVKFGNSANTTPVIEDDDDNNDNVSAYNAETEEEVVGSDSNKTPSPARSSKKAPEKKIVDATSSSTGTDNVCLLTESSDSSPKRLLSRKTRTERRNTRLARRERSPRTIDDEIKSLTNLKTLRSRRRVLQSDSESGGDKENKPVVKPKSKPSKIEKKETLLDMVNMLCSESGEELGDEQHPDITGFVSNAKAVFKELVLNSSSSDEESTDALEGESQKEEKQKLKRKRNIFSSSSGSEGIVKKLKKNFLSSDVSLTDSDTVVKRKKKKKSTDSDSDKTVEQKSHISESSNSDSVVKKGKKRIKLMTDSSYSESDLSDKKSKKKKTSSDSNTLKKKKFKRIAADKSSSESTSSGVEFISQGSNKSPQKGRKNIKKLMKKDALQEETIGAVKTEEQRKKRLKERDKKYEELFGDRTKQLVLDFDESGEILLEVDPRLVKRLKPHQRKGVKFMWDNCFGSLKEMESSNGGGCILAHCMGLGKTMQVVTLLHTILSDEIDVKTALIVCPLNTVANWYHECEMWLEVARCDTIDVYDVHKHKQLQERRFILRTWHRKGGILIISYDMYRNLTKKKKNSEDETLVRPGPDIIVCDEGHLLKNEDSARSRCLSKVQTCRRIVLTGTPLQNNLGEYHCMVQFIKPNILGTKKEFANRFVNPIVNGQFEDSTRKDVEIMKRRSHVLHTMLEGCIQRCDYSVLTPFLPVKHEFVLSLTVAEPMAKAYSHFLLNISAKSTGSKATASLFNDFHTLQQIWTHPLAMRWHQERAADRKAKLAEEDEVEGFVDDREENEMSVNESTDSSVACLDELVSKKSTRANPVELVEPEETPPEKQWWEEFINEEMFEDESISTKLVILFSILEESEKRGDKVLVFSQSLTALDLIEYFLEKRAKKGEEWYPARNYFRLDGKSSSEKRAAWCKAFNRETNTAAKLFLISTKAGGLGINLVGANRVIIFDASWNPSHDLQSIFRIYRFGQKKPCYVYRLLAEATMEEKIYERQVTKLSLAGRVVDEHQIERHYTMGNLQELYRFEPVPKELWKSPVLPKDDILAKILKDHSDIVVGYHEHDSLLENKEGEELTEEERKAAWEEYELAQRPPPPPPPVAGFNPMQLHQLQTQYALANSQGMMYQGTQNIPQTPIQFINHIRQNFPYKNFLPLANLFQSPNVADAALNFLHRVNLYSVSNEEILRIAQMLKMKINNGESDEEFRKRVCTSVETIRQQTPM